MLRDGSSEMPLTKLQKVGYILRQSQIKLFLKMTLGIVGSVTPKQSGGEAEGLIELGSKLNPMA